MAIVGAGPGDPGLLTVRAIQWLESADVVIHDALVSEAVLAHVRPGATVIDAGKRHSRKNLTQDQINELLVENARAGKRVVRLKGGDPCLFGRIAEEIAALRNAGIPFEIVPGVSSGTAVAAVARIGLTERTSSSAVVFVTGHEASDKSRSTVDWSRVAAVGGTIVVFMGVRRLAEIAEALIAGGLSPETPALVVEWATMPRQRMVRAPLASLAAGVEQVGLSPPATIVIGEVAAMADVEEQTHAPLAGRTVVVTRAREQAQELAVRLERLGAHVVHMPAIEIAPLSDFSELDAAIGRLEDYRWIAFTSANAVHAFFDRLYARGRDARALSHSRIAAVGEKTAEVLRSRGVRPDVVPATANAEELATAIIARGAPGEKVLFPAGRRSRETLPRRLEDAGFVVERVVCYEARDVAVPSSEAVRDLSGAKEAWVTVMSPATARATHRLLKQIPQPPARVHWVAISPATADLLRELGEGDVIVAREASVDGVVDAIVGAVEANTD